jgi:trimethylamine:corrinoid methyltransferase-like protein
MDIEIILQSSKAGLPIHACSLPGAGGTAPATLPAVILLTTAEILAMLAMAQAVAPGTPIVACPIIFSMDMQTGRSLQSSVEALKCASGAIQFIKAAFNLPTHNYGSGSDAPNVDGQSMSERAMLSTLMGVSGLDILGGAGQLEVATAVSPLQLIVDNEVIGMLRQIMSGLTYDDEHLAWNTIVDTKPGNHFLTSEHTYRHCREGYIPQNFIRLNREDWERQGSKSLLDRTLQRYHSLMDKDNAVFLTDDLTGKVNSIVESADKNLVQ